MWTARHAGTCSGQSRHAVAFRPHVAAPRCGPRASGVAHLLIAPGRGMSANVHMDIAAGDPDPAGEDAARRSSRRTHGKPPSRACRCGTRPRQGPSRAHQNPGNRSLRPHPGRVPSWPVLSSKKLGPAQLPRAPCGASCSSYARSFTIRGLGAVQAEKVGDDPEIVDDLFSGTDGRPADEGRIEIADDFRAGCL